MIPFMAIIRLKHKVISTTEPMASCWYCDEPTNKALYGLDGSEVWCCDKCYNRKGKVRKHKKSSKPSKVERQSTIFSGIIKEKNNEMAIVAEGCEEK